MKIFENFFEGIFKGFMYTTMTGSELKWHSGALMIFSAIYLLLVGFLGPVLKITQNFKNVHSKIFQNKLYGTKNNTSYFRF